MMKGGYKVILLVGAALAVLWMLDPRAAVSIGR
jgi:hypothetical protein